MNSSQGIGFVDAYSPKNKMAETFLCTVPKCCPSFLRSLYDVGERRARVLACVPVVVDASLARRLTLSFVACPGGTARGYAHVNSLNPARGKQPLARMRHEGDDPVTSSPHPHASSRPLELTDTRISPCHNGARLLFFGSFFLFRCMVVVTSRRVLLFFSRGLSLRMRSKAGRWS